MSERGAAREATEASIASLSGPEFSVGADCHNSSHSPPLLHRCLTVEPGSQRTCSAKSRLEFVVSVHIAQRA
jgi:hypothetical protein